VTARHRQVLLVIIGCLVIVLVGMSAARGTPSTARVAAGQPSPSPEPVASIDLTPRIAIVYDPDEDSGGGLNLLAREGAKRFADAFEGEFKEVGGDPDDTDADREARLAQLAQARYYPIFVVGSSYAEALAAVAPQYPRSKFAVVDDGSVDGSNVVGILFDDGQGAFIVGAAAALTSKGGKVGFIGAAPTPTDQKLEAGFTAGARAADPDVTVQVDYLATTPGDPATGDPAKAHEVALGMYDAGADVIFAAASDAGDGVFQAAHDRGRWAIGVDTDRYLAADGAVRSAILTSMLKRADIATYAIGMEIAHRVAKDGNNVFGVGQDGVGYATSGGFVDPIKAQLDDFATKIAAGEILVPRKP
jgi:basic membrane protein A